MLCQQDLYLGLNSMIDHTVGIESVMCKPIYGHFLFIQSNGDTALSHALLEMA